jgi:hypothetical protein
MDIYISYIHTQLCAMCTVRLRNYAVSLLSFTIPASSLSCVFEPRFPKQPVVGVVTWL